MLPKGEHMDMNDKSEYACSHRFLHWGDTNLNSYFPWGLIPICVYVHLPPRGTLTAMGNMVLKSNIAK